MKSSLSLHLIAKDEEHNLKPLIESVKDVVDEIYLTDTGSTDGTIELAKSLGCEVSQFKWINDFSAARNFNFQFGKTDYQMWLDCDDSLKDAHAFKLWREELMPLADYHLATYHYANVEGVPTCSFLRERVIKRDKGFKWEYFLHEGIKPVGNGPIRQDVAKTWSVWHRRSEADLKADRSRNLNLFRGRERLLDARMTMYHAKELFESGFFEQAITWMNKALTMPLELHDKLIGYQYLAYALSAQAAENLELAQKYGDDAYNQNALKYMEEALRVCFEGLLIDPHRAEFSATISDIYLRVQQFGKAIPWLSMAKAAIPQLGAAANGTLFTSDEAYSKHPRTQLTKAYANLGLWDRSKIEAIKLHEKHPSDESKMLLGEINKALNFNVISKDVIDTDDIVISCPPNAGFFEWDGEVYREKFCGGSETAAVEMAENLAKITGRKVYIFNSRKEAKLIHGVHYIPVGELHEYFSKFKPWLHIAWRHSTKLTDAFSILWCHDLFTAGSEAIDNYNFIACLTPFHQRFTQAKMGIPLNKTWVTRNGLNPEKFKIEAGPRDPFSFVFSSSPDRGLDRAMRVLDRVREKYPQITLKVHYGIEHLEKYGLGDMQKMLKQMMDERPWVKYIGKTSQPDLIKSFKESAYCVQPSDFIETSMISANERLACGVYQIIRNVGAVQDTLKWASENKMADLVDSDCITEKDHDLYAERVIQAIEQEAYKRVSFDPDQVSWEKVALEWIEFRKSQKL